MKIFIIFALISISVFAGDKFKYRLRIGVDPIPNFSVSDGTSRIQQADGTTTFGFTPVNRNFQFGLQVPLFKDTGISLDNNGITWASFYIHDFDLKEDVVNITPGNSENLYPHNLNGPSIGIVQRIRPFKTVESSSFISLGVLWGHNHIKGFTKIPYLRYDFPVWAKLPAIYLSAQSYLIPKDGMIYSLQISLIPDIFFWRS